MISTYQWQIWFYNPSLENFLHMMRIWEIEKEFFWITLKFNWINYDRKKLLKYVDGLRRLKSETNASDMLTFLGKLELTIEGLLSLKN